MAQPEPQWRRSQSRRGTERVEKTTVRLIDRSDRTKALSSRLERGVDVKSLCLSNTEVDAVVSRSIRLVPAVKPSVD